MSERIDSTQAAALLGYTPRRIRQMAAGGKIPGAIQLEDGGKWTFDKNRLMQFMMAKEKKPCQFTSATTSTGYAFNFRGGKSASPLTQQISAALRHLKGESANA